MQLACSRCGRMLEYSSEPPSYCAFCGQALAETRVESTVGQQDHGVTSPVAPLPIFPERIGAYRLIRRVGSGGMGTVYEAEDESSGGHVAVKLLARDLASSPDALERFRREGRLASAIAHPRCVFVLTADEEAGQPFIVMELMPGETLRDYVQQHGLISASEAVRKILDVIQGLLEVHRCGVIHRDVKPSNCFLEADGRVKVGDFGLARALTGDANLTQTGHFVGTPLFASPEQHKGEPVDVRTDVYSVAATIYYLLTGKAPFEGGDSAAVVARVASEDARSMLALRPDLPRRLDRVVLRGLERDRRRRWSDLPALRRALLPFVSTRQTTGALLLRFFAYLIDWGLLLGVLWLIVTFVKPFWPNLSVAHEGIWQFLLSITPDLVYFGVLEGFAGLSLGKWLLRLRVYRSWENRPPGLFRALLRTALFIFLCHFPETFLDALPLDCWTKLWFAMLIRLKVFGALLILTTMRARNGFRGLHELLSGTRTVRLLRIGKTTQAAWNLGRPHPAGVWTKRETTADVPSSVGPFRVIGALAAEAGHRVLLGEDPVLERRVLLWLRPAGDPPVSEERRGVGRATRTRWLSSGQGDGQWDAFTEPIGCSLPALTADGPLAWSETLLILSQLADELEASLADHTLPRTLSVDQIWVAPTGQVQLLDMPLCSTMEPQPDAVEAEERRAVRFLNEVADYCLRGGSRRQMRTPVPLYAADFLARLGQAPPAFASVARVRSELANMQVRPVMVSRVQRAVHLVVQGAVLVLGILLAIVVGSYFFDIRLSPGLEAVSYIVFTSVSVILAASLRGGPSFGIVGIGLVRSDGQRAAWWQAAARSLLVWLQMWTLTLSGLWLGDHINGAMPGARSQEGDVKVYQVPTDITQSPGHLIALLCVLGYGAAVVWWPRRPWHDHVVGTHLVPE